MKNLITIVLLCFVVESKVQSCNEVQSQVAQANDQFAIDLLNKLDFKNDNVFFSPMSISAAMSMLSLGAAGNTLKEINSALHFDYVKSSDPMALHKAFQNIIQEYGRNNSNYSLSLANRLFAQEDYEIKKKFLDETGKYYEATVENVDFASGGAEGIINEWVEKQTNGKIKDLFAPGSLSADTILALVNAIYFKGKWQEEFNKKDTQDLDFFVAENDSKKVKMMSIQSKFMYSENPALKIQILRMPYTGNDLSMNIILPQQGELSKLIPKLNSQELRTLMKGMYSTKVNVKLPSFKLETSYSLIEELQKLGINDAFSSKADLSGIGNGSLQVSKVVHKAYVDVNEEGTEATAATGIGIELTSVVVGENRIKNFNANHPFLFLITDERYDSEILFMGTVINPE